ncbi:MAG: amidohydrolase family protein, partial [Firmicutes bacterium]|nr:amidohydrolase family protein [Bacillota bacterium]
KTTLALLEAARERGVAAGCDVYPYTAASTSLGSLVPSWAHAGGKEAFLGRLRDPAVRERLKREIEEGIPGWENFIAAAGYDNILITRANRPDSDLPGQTIAEIARARQTEPAETVFDLLLEEENNIGMVLFLMQEEDVREVIRFPGAVIGSDASAAAPYGPLGKGKPHPRSYGTFARILGKYVRQEGLLSLEEAISKMTSQTAEKYGLKGRGILQRGYQADLVVFDRQKISDRASYQEPHQYAQGVEYVLVNGVMTVAKGEHTGALAGRVLRRGQKRTRSPPPHLNRRRWRGEGTPGKTDRKAFLAKGESLAVSYETSPISASLPGLGRSHRSSRSRRSDVFIVCGAAGGMRNYHETNQPLPGRRSGVAVLAFRHLRRPYPGSARSTGRQRGDSPSVGSGVRRHGHLVQKSRLDSLRLLIS